MGTRPDHLPSIRAMNVLVTAGNTKVLIDRVRCLTNIFTGRTGTAIALHAHERGHDVTLLTSRPEAVAEIGQANGGPAHRWAVRRYETFADLEPYCHRVASAVGLICSEIFGYTQPAALDYARDLGVALQLTNILRDVGVDYRRGRFYLPLEDLQRFGCVEEDVAREVDEAGAGVKNDRVRAVLEHHAARARVFFSRAARALPAADAPSFLPAEIMRAIYFDLLRRIEVARCDVFTAVIRVPRPAQARLAVRTWWRVRSGRAAR